MFLEVVRSEGLSHLSFVVGDAGRAAVIDPRRDCDVYLDHALRNGARITHIIETHRQEDFLTGSKELSLLTSAAVYHGSRAAYRFGNPALDGDRFELGRVRLTILDTPGHTPESISIAVADLRFSETPVAVFTGDTLTIGSAGRVDMFPGREREAAGAMYDSIFNRLLPLGDHVVVYPAHTGEYPRDEPERLFSTLGYERRFNPSLMVNGRDDFIDARMGERDPLSPHATLMLRQNLDGPPLMNGLPHPQPYRVKDFIGAMESGLIMVDTRGPETAAVARLPGGLSLPMEFLSAFAGWFIPYNQPIGLVVSEPEQVETAVRRLARVGYDRIPAFLATGAHSGEPGFTGYEVIPTIHLEDMPKSARKRSLLLDLRRPREYRAGHPDGSLNLFVGDIPNRLSEIPRDRPLILYSGGYGWAVMAASILRMNGIGTVQIGLDGESTVGAAKEHPSELADVDMLAPEEASPLSRLVVLGQR